MYSGLFLFSAFKKKITISNYSTQFYFRLNFIYLLLNKVDIMCYPSKQIKFCTCVDRSTPFETLRYRWVLEKESEIQIDIYGVMTMPKESPSEVYTREIYLKALNQEDAFDMDYNFRDGDQITLYHQSDLDKNKAYEWEFTYKFEEGRWLPSGRGAFTSYDWIVRGKIDRR